MLAHLAIYVYLDLNFSETVRIERTKAVEST